MTSLKQILRRVSAAIGAVALGVTLPGSAAAEDMRVETRSDAAPNGPALWKVTDKDTTIYLFGTVHALPKDVQWMDDEIRSALANADELVTEVDLKSASGASPAIMQIATLPDGRNLREMMPAADRTAYEAAMTGLGLPVAAFDRLEPWYAALMLSTLPLMRDGYSPETGVESVLEKQFDAARPRDALETVEYQLGLFDGLPMDTQLAYLGQVVTSVPDMKSKLDEMVARWLVGDADSLARLMNEEETDPMLLERLLIQRNRTWAGWINQRLNKPGTVFIAVGAGHLAGADSVQEILAQRGIRTDRVQ